MQKKKKKIGQSYCPSGIQDTDYYIVAILWKFLSGTCPKLFHFLLFHTSIGPTLSKRTALATTVLTVLKRNVVTAE